MAKGFDAKQERLAQISRLGKNLGKQAKFKCEWCEGKNDLRPFETQAKAQPDLDNLLFLCQRCREIASGGKVPAAELRNLVEAMWSERDLVKERLAEVLVRCGERWAIDAVENAWMNEEVKAKLLENS